MCYFLDSHRSTQDMPSLRQQTEWAGLQVWITWLKQWATSCQDGPEGDGAIRSLQPPVAWCGPDWCCGRWRGRGRMAMGSGSPGELLGLMGNARATLRSDAWRNLSPSSHLTEGGSDALDSLSFNRRTRTCYNHQSSDPERRIWTRGPDWVRGNFIFDRKPAFIVWI